MTVFGAYAGFYDALYADKDYAGECRYVRRLLAAESPRPVRTLLDLGCGTGNHDLLFARAGLDVTGVDRSRRMLAEFRAKARAEATAVHTVRGDLRTVRLGSRFDAVVSLFAVMGYQTTNRDVSEALDTAATHLKRGAPFLFDVWYGPSVLRDPPATRRKRVASGGGWVERTTTCAMDELTHTVDIRFRTRLRRGRSADAEVDETHRMRFFFPQELAAFLDGAGLELRRLVPFMKMRGRPDPSTWTVTVVARKR